MSSIVYMGGVKTAWLSPSFGQCCFEIVYFPNVWFVQTGFRLLMQIHCTFLPANLGTIPYGRNTIKSVALAFCLSARHIGHSFVHKHHSGLTTINSAVNMSFQCCCCCCWVLSFRAEQEYKGFPLQCWADKCEIYVHMCMSLVLALKGLRRKKMKKCSLVDDVIYEVSAAEECRVSTAPPKTRCWTE